MKKVLDGVRYCTPQHAQQHTNELAKEQEDDKAVFQEEQEDTFTVSLSVIILRSLRYLSDLDVYFSIQWNYVQDRDAQSQPR
jgi:hypothetical protein